MKSRTATSFILSLTFSFSPLIFFSLISSAVTAQVVINEIMWDEIQYVELYNKSDSAVNLAEWSLHSENGLIANFAAVQLSAGEYFLIEEDESATFISSDLVTPLNLKRQTGDLLVLKDNQGNTIDTANQDKGGWFAGADTPSGIAMERVNPEVPGNVAANWTNSTAYNGGRYGTPKTINSVFSASEPLFLISKVNFKNHPDWVEINCVNDGNNGNGLDLTGYYLTDMAAPDKTLAGVTIKSGESLKITYSSDNPDESAVNIGNQDGVIDLYTTVNGLISTDEQVVFVDAGDNYLDAVCWSDGVLPANEITDLNELVSQSQWTGNNALDCVNSQEILSGFIISRRGNQDTNSAQDWEVLDLNNDSGNSSTITVTPVNTRLVKDFTIEPNPLWLDHQNQEKRKTRISFYLEEEAEVTAVIYDSMGRSVRRLKSSDKLLTGENHFFWHGRNINDESVPVGIYLLYLKIYNQNSTKQKIKTIVVGRKK